MPKRTDRQLLSLALSYAIEEREGFLSAIRGTDPENEARVASLIEDWKALHLRKFGSKTSAEQQREADAAVPSISIFDLAKQSK